ncbi:MAG: TonB family protein, partial [Deltaproteobacteria bacterium]|nr:TonB family protein [Deltaproteobacteria bacterium]
WVAANHEGPGRVLVIGDGVVTAGASEPDELRTAAKTLARKGVTRLDVVVDGTVRDATTLAAITRGNLESDGVITDARLTPRSIAIKLLRATRSGVAVTVPGAKWVWPETLDGVQPGDQILIYAELKSGQPFKIRAEHDPRGEQEIPLRPAERPLMHRAWIRANIARLEHLATKAQTDAEKDDLKQKIIDLSIRHRVLSKHTALLVLETEADYRRYGIDRKARTDMVTIGADGLEVLKRTDEPLAVLSPKEIDARDKERTKRVKNLGRRFCWGGGLAGIGRGGGIGRLLRGITPTTGQPFSNIDLALSNVMGASGSGGMDEMGLAGVGVGGGGGGGGDGMGMGSLKSSGGLGGRRGWAPKIKPGNAMIKGSLSKEVIRRIIRRHINEVKYCYEKELQKNQRIGGRVVIKFIISPTGAVLQSKLHSSTVKNAPVEQCITRAARRWTFPAPEGGGIVIVTYPFVLTPTGGAGSGGRGNLGAKYWPRAKPKTENAYEGRFAELMTKIKDGDKAGALADAWSWWGEAPHEVAALIALGEALEANGQLDLAARAYGSLIDLFPSRADLRRMAGERLERLGDAGLALATDSFRVAADQRPDHPTGHRLYGYALAKAGRYEQAFAALRKGYEHDYPKGRFRRVKRVLREDLGLIAAAWIRTVPSDEQRVRDAIKELEIKVANKPSTRFVLYWESDLTNVDLRVHDNKNHVAYWKSSTLPGGGALYANVINGYGPECFAIAGEAKAYPYTIQAHYVRRGPMGYGMGKLQIVEHDGKGNLAFSERPFLIQRDGAYVDLGRLEATLLTNKETK